MTAALKHLAHPLLAVVIQLAIWVVTGSLWAGAIAASLGYLFREMTQAEYRWIEHHGSGLRANMPWWAPFDLREWSSKDWTDWLGPLVATSLVAAVMS